LGVRVEPFIDLLIEELERVAGELAMEAFDMDRPGAGGVWGAIPRVLVFDRTKFLLECMNLWWSTGGIRWLWAQIERERVVVGICPESRTATAARRITAALTARPLVLQFR